MASSSAAEGVEDLDWEEWDASSSPLSFFDHCLAGSFAGVMEHTLLYPLDTVKTCWQSQVLNKAASSSGGGSGVAGCSLVGGGNGGGMMSGVMKGLTTNASTTTLAAASTSSLGNYGIGLAGTTTQQYPQMMQASSHSSLNTIQSSHGIWSTMKHLMNQGGGGAAQSQQSLHPITQLVKAQMVTMAQQHHAPNVVDLTDLSTKSSARSNSSGNSTSRRPWSQHGRAIRGATISDITSSGAIRSSSFALPLSSSSSSSTATGGITNMTILLGERAGSGNNGSTTAAGGGGFKRLWRGVQAMFLGCIPAHALYFSSYEIIKSICLTTDQVGGGSIMTLNHANHHHTGGGGQDENANTHVGHDTLSPTQAMLAGTVATLLHDFVMTPMDTMKQRLQLGHYNGLHHAFISIVKGDVVAGVPGEGWGGLYRSFPVTVMTNVPYGMIMMTTNEWLRGVLEDGLYGSSRRTNNNNDIVDNDDGGGGGGGGTRGGGGFHFVTILLSGMGAGTVASALTAPLDRVKTRLQTQRMGIVDPSGSNRKAGSSGETVAILEERALAAAQGKPMVCPKTAMANARSILTGGDGVAMTSSSTSMSRPPTLHHSSSTSMPFKTYYSTPLEAFNSILVEEGPRGLFRGTVPRVALHAPSVAISWTAYEMAKEWLLWAK
jgi:solute carrier family 25 iron transporter 28/37